MARRRANQYRTIPGVHPERRDTRQSVSEYLVDDEPHLPRPSRRRYRRLHPFAGRRLADPAAAASPADLAERQHDVEEETEKNKVQEQIKKIL